MPVSEFLRVSTTVSDLFQAETFYRDAIGFTRAEERVIDDPAWARLMGLPAGSTARCLVVTLGAQEVELVSFDVPGRSYPEARASNDPWFQHIALVVDDIAAIFEGLHRMETTPISIGGPQLLPVNTGGVSAFKFRDPDGHPLELLYFPPGVGDLVWHGVQDSKPRGYDHTAIAVGDIDRSIAFYADILGFHVAARSLNKGAEQDRLDGLSETEVDVVGLAPADVPTPHVELLHYRTPRFEGKSVDVAANDVASTRQVHRVDDLDGLAARLKGSSAGFVSPGVVTLGDGARAATIRDPDGHMIVLTE